MVDLGNITFIGKSGKQYVFSIYNTVTSFKAIGGIYIFLRKEQDTYYHVYCGKTDNLSTRFDNHHKADCIRKNGANRICAMLVSTEKERTTIEEDILANNNFSCNEMLN